VKPPPQERPAVRIGIGLLAPGSSYSRAFPALLLQSQWYPRIRPRLQWRGPRRHCTGFPFTPTRGLSIGPAAPARSTL